MTLSETCRELKRQRKKVLAVYLTAGDPSVAASVDAAVRAARAGADVLEIGVPFSDPVADGPVIQRAMLRALAHGGGVAQSIEAIRAIRREVATPIVVFGYANPLLWSGVAATCKQYKEAGADALLLVDAPPEESGPIAATAREAGLDWVGIVAPTSGPTRAAAIARQASGFVYLVSMTGVTGGELVDPGRLAPMIAAIRSASDLPVCVGFGIRDRQSAARAARVGDGVVVGSAIVRALEEGMAAGEGSVRVGELVKELRGGLDENLGD